MTEQTPDRGREPTPEQSPYGTPPGEGGTPLYGTPQDGTPQYGTPQYGTPPAPGPTPTHGTPAEPYGSPPPYHPPPAQPSQPSQYRRPSGPLRPSDERLWATLGHLGGMLLSVIPALVVYLMLKDRSAFVAANAKEALNFQITVLITWIVVSIVLPPLTGLIWIGNVVFCVIAAIAANRGQQYRYPLTLRPIR